MAYASPLGAKPVGITEDSFISSNIGDGGLQYTFREAIPAATRSL